MTEAQDKAITRACQHECLMRELVEALTDLCNIYASVWDLVDGNLLLMKESIPRYEKAQANARAALARAKEQQK